MKALVAVLIGIPLFAAETRITFQKTFPGSVPAYVEISVDKSGAGEYKEEAADENPLKFILSEADTRAMFACSEKLGHFSQPIESGLKVAFMGAKTFRYSDGTAPPKEVKFNYSENLDAKTLLDYFERIAETERGYIELERSIRFDKLGVHDALLKLEALRNQQRLMGEQQFLPMLDRVAKGEIYLHMARARAAGLAETIRAAGNQPAEAPPGTAAPPSPPVKETP